jgi:hypothetical protein
MTVREREATREEAAEVISTALGYHGGLPSDEDSRRRVIERMLETIDNLGGTVRLMVKVDEEVQGS